MNDEKNVNNNAPSSEVRNQETAKTSRARREAADSMKFQSNLLKTSQKKNRVAPGFARKWQYGTISIGLVIAFIAVIIMANIGISFLTNRFYLKLDMTPTSYYEISNTTKSLLSNMKEDVNVHILLSENDVVNSKYYSIAYEFLQKYRALSGGKVNIDFVDIYKNPNFINAYTDTPEEISAGSFIVESPLRYKILKLSDLYKLSVHVTDQSTYSYEQYVSGIEADQTLVSALQYVLAEDLPTVAFITGHNEQYSQDFISLFTNSNYNYEEVNIVFNEIPHDAAITVVGIPEADWTNEQIDRLDSYLTGQNGKVLFFTGLKTADTPLLDEWLQEWGVAVRKTMVLDSSRALGNPLGIVADITDTSVCPDVNVTDTSYLLMPNSVALDIMWEADNHRSTAPILTSSATSYGKDFTNYNDVKSYAQADGDAEGPFNLGVMCSYSATINSVSTAGKMIVLSSNYMMADTYLEMQQLVNKDYLLSLIDYMYEGVDPLIVEGSEYTSSAMTILSSQARTVLWILVVIIPAVILALGIYVWLRRRHK